MWVVRVLLTLYIYEKSRYFCIDEYSVLILVHSSRDEVKWSNVGRERSGRVLSLCDVAPGRCESLSTGSRLTIHLPSRFAHRYLELLALPGAY